MTTKPNPQRIEIFRAGRQTAASGQTIDFTDAHLQAVVDAYDPALHEAPLCVGHPKSDLPAYGWVRGLQLDGGLLYADADQVDPAFAELVRSGRYKKRSAAFYPPDCPSNPRPGSYYLRHVAYLGAQPPAVKGLRDVHFDGGDDGALEFMDWAAQESAGLWGRMREWLISKFGMDEADRVLPGYAIDMLKREANAPAAADATTARSLSYADPGADTVTTEQLAAQAAQIATERAALDARAAALTQREQAAVQAARMAEFGEFTGGLVKTGQLLPVQQARLLAVMGALPAAQVVEFAEGGATVNKPALQVLQEFLSGLPKQVVFREVAGRTAAAGVDTADATSIHRAALEFREAESKAGRSVSVEAAVQHVMDANHDDEEATQ